MWNEPGDSELARLPALYATEHVPTADKIVHIHFFLGGCDWYAVEYSPQERVLFSFAILNDDLQNAEWGYTSYDELRSIRTPHGIEVDRDLNWTPRKASEIERIVLAGGWSKG